jgi:hypothetical protein
LLTQEYEAIIEPLRRIVNEETRLEAVNTEKTEQELEDEADGEFAVSWYNSVKEMNKE